MSTHRSQLWILVVVAACLIGLSQLMHRHEEPAPERVATPTEANEPATELADDPAAPAPSIAPRPSREGDEPKPPGVEAPQPSAADAPAAASNTPTSTEFENTPRKRSAEPMRLHFAHTPETRTPGIGLSKAACAELREREQRSESLSDRELLHLKIDCRGR